MDTLRVNKFFYILLIVLVAGCRNEPSKEEIAAAKKKCNESGAYEGGIYIDFSGFKKSEIDETVTTINKDSLGKTISIVRDTLKVLKNNPEDCIILYKYSSPFRLNSTLEITFGKEKYILSHFILKPEIVTAGIGRRIIIGCMLDSVTVNNKIYTGSAYDDRFIEIRKTDSR